MFRRILVPLDGSKLAEVAVSVAARLAQLARAELEFVLVHEPALSAVPVSDAFVFIEDETVSRERERRYLDEVVGRVQDLPQSRISTRLLDGVAGPTLAREITSRQPDLVVLSTHGRGPLSRMWLGSVTDYLLRHVSVPLLVLKPRDATDSPPPDFHLESILVASDLSPLGEAILQPVSELARLTGARIDLVHVVDSAFGLPVSTFPLAFDAGLVEQQREEAEQELARVAAPLRASGLTVETQVTFGAGTAMTVAELANENGYDLVALTTHGRDGVARALLGSVADKVIRAADKPVLVVRPALKDRRATRARSQGAAAADARGS
jgi:nucleotide-binding universal stress UspA family protein